MGVEGGGGLREGGGASDWDLGLSGIEGNLARYEVEVSSAATTVLWDAEEKLRWSLDFMSRPRVRAAAHNNRKPPRLDFARRRQIQRRPLKSNEVVIVFRRIYWLRLPARAAVHASTRASSLIAPGIHSRSRSRARN